MTEITVVGAGGEYMESVVVVEWHKKLGDPVKAGELVVTVETAKAATEIEATADGLLSEILASVGDEVPVGAVLGIIGDGVKSARTDAPSVRAPVESASENRAVLQVADANNDTRIVASPLARRIAAQKDVDLSKVRPSSQSGRIRVRDVDAYASSKETLQDAKGLSPEVAHTLAVVADERKSSAALNIVTRGPVGAERIVFIHGFGSDGPSWQPLISAIGSGYRFIMVDLPCHGQSPRPDFGLDVHSLAETVLNSLTTAGIDDFHLVGHSLGGAVSLALAARARLSIRSVTLLAPAGLGPDIDGSFVSGFAKASQVESLAPWLARCFANPSMASPAFVSATMAARSDANLRAAQERLAQTVFPDGTQSINLREVLKDLLVPQSIIWGEQDRIIPMHHALGTGGSAGLHFLPGVGHLPHVESPAVVARLLLQNIRCGLL